MKLTSRRLALSAFLVFTILSIHAAAQQPELLIPANTKVSVQLLSEISTATAKKNDKFTCRVLSPAEYAGAIIEGHVRSAKRSGKADKESKIELDFDRISLVDGRLASFSATVIEVFDVVGAAQQGRADNEGTVKNKSSTVKISAKRALIGAAFGALIGGAIAGGQGAAVGAAIGAGAGITSTLVMKGEDLNFKTGTQLTIQTDGPTRRRSLRKGETAISVPSEPTANQANSGNVNPAINGNSKDDRPILKPREHLSPAKPSDQVRLISGAGYVVGMPDNWTQSGSNNQLMFAPEGGSKVTNGVPEITHGALIGIFNAGNNDLQKVTEAFLSIALQRNSYLRRVGNVETISIDGTPAYKTNLSGIGKEGRMELVSVYTTLTRNRQLFYLITTVPEGEAELYSNAFRSVVMSVKFTR